MNFDIVSNHHNTAGFGKSRTLFLTSTSASAPKKVSTSLLDGPYTQQVFDTMYRSSMDAFRRTLSHRTVSFALGGSVLVGYSAWHLRQNQETSISSV